MSYLQKLGALAAEISSLESETFEVADYAEANDLFMVGGPSACSCSATCSSTSCTA
jgi:thiazolylpeptide-type bacteriocin precursor